MSLEIKDLYERMLENTSIAFDGTPHVYGQSEADYLDRIRLTLAAEEWLGRIVDELYDGGHGR